MSLLKVTSSNVLTLDEHLFLKLMELTRSERTNNTIFLTLNNTGSLVQV